MGNTNLYVCSREGAIMKILFLMLISMVIFYFVDKNKNKELITNKDKNEYIVRTTKIYVWIGIIATSILLTAYILASVFSEDKGKLWIKVAFIGLILLCVMYTNSTISRRIFVNSNSDFFIYRTFFWKKYEIKYSDINDVGENLLFSYIKSGRKTFYIDKEAYNFELFKNIIEQKTMRKFK